MQGPVVPEIRSRHLFLQQRTKANAVVPQAESGADDVCRALFRAEALLMDEFDDLRSQLTDITGVQVEEPRALLINSMIMFSLRVTKPG
ncbi:unnamed protein product [Taenia asiatica]|uniref:AAA_9 domain-containing protein n=1 Tax=Taenia asiatica TaxID=60517 RepID=A0A0R3VYA5_TAEAS|nr:unnamed protein product [Taenia asiatica]